jgi:serine O-acetyltransferase
MAESSEHEREPIPEEVCEEELEASFETAHEWLSRLPSVVEKILTNLHELGSADRILTYALPSESAVVTVLDLLTEIVFPGYAGSREVEKANLQYHVGSATTRAYNLLAEQITKCIRHTCRRTNRPMCSHCVAEGHETAYGFLERIPALTRVLEADIQAAYEGDPAATGYDEVIFCYPGLRAVFIQRFAHELHEMGVPLLPRIMTEHAHRITGIDIHPGAQIGRHFFIDHGTGVVIGETTEIGDNVKLYQGVTLGALSFPTDEKGNLLRGRKRHPTIEEDVVIYSGASILGPVRIGKGSVIGGNVFLTHDVEPGSKVTIEKPKLRIRRGEEEA